MVQYTMIGIIDYNAGNIQSVEHALASLGIEYCISKDPENLKLATKFLFPGVGNAEFAMSELKKTGFGEFLKEKAQDGFPILGICLGSQIIFDYSEEGNIDCLGLLQGSIRHFSNIIDDKTHHLKVPHMGWNNISFQNNCPLFAGIENNTDFYFVHSYAIQPKDSSIISAICDYGIPFPAAVWKDNMYACQFHPEKSGKAGLQILQNFANLNEVPSC